MTNKRVITTAQRDAMRKKLRKKRKIIKLISLVLFVALVAASISFYSVVKSFNVLPAKYMTLIVLFLVFSCLFWGFFALLPGFKNGVKIFQTIMCALLSILLLGGTVVLPVYRAKIEKMFVKVPEKGDLAINFYVLTTNTTGSSINADAKNVEWLAGKKVAIQKNLDNEYQDFAIKVVNKEIKGSDIKTVEIEGIFEAVDALINKEVSAIMLNESYVSVIEQVTGYENFSSITKVLYSSIQQIDLGVDAAAIANVAKQPFVIGVLAQDSWDYGDISKNTGFRSDVNMAVVVNPQTKQILIVTVPRDAYVPMLGNANQMDKLTHSPTREGVNGWKKTMEKFLGIDMNYYIRVNFTSLMDVVDALGGITVDNPKAFTTNYLGQYDPTQKKPVYTSYKFEAGTLELDGLHALAFVRERKHLSNGDMGRNEHQAMVIKACIDKCTSPAILGSADKLLATLQGKFQSNLTFNEITALAAMQLDDMADWEIFSCPITGSTGLAPSYYASQKELSMVFPSTSTVNSAKNQIKKIMAGEKLTSK